MEVEELVLTFKIELLNLCRINRSVNSEYVIDELRQDNGHQTTALKLSEPTTTVWANGVNEACRKINKVTR